jgi:hypothetical protein
MKTPAKRTCGSYEAYDLNTQALSPQAARVTNTGRQHREDDSLLWLVGADTSLYAAWLGVYSWQLLRDVVGPVVGRRDLAG